MKTWLLLIGGFLTGAIAHKTTLDFIFGEAWDRPTLAVMSLVFSFFTMLATVAFIACTRK